MAPPSLTRKKTPARAVTEHRLIPLWPAVLAFAMGKTPKSAKAHASRA